MLLCWTELHSLITRRHKRGFADILFDLRLNFRNLLAVTLLVIIVLMEVLAGRLLLRAHIVRRRIYSHIVLLGLLLRHPLNYKRHFMRGDVSVIERLLCDISREEIFVSYQGEPFIINDNSGNFSEHSENLNRSVKKSTYSLKILFVQLEV